MDQDMQTTRKPLNIFEETTRGSLKNMINEYVMFNSREYQGKISSWISNELQKIDNYTHHFVFHW